MESDPIGLRGGLSTYGYVGSSPIFWMDLDGLARQNLNLGQGWSGGLDMIPGSEGQFEIHVFDPKGVEVGMYGEKGWFDKHGHKGRPAKCPAEVENRLKGTAVDILRRSGKLPEKGRGNIKGSRWMGGGGALGSVGILGGVIHLFTLEACTKGTTTQCFCALEAEQMGRDPGACMQTPKCLDCGT